jgi:uroporphyrinogen-III decarboxylase
MTGRERLLKTFRREPVDRVPICPFVHFNHVYRHFDIPPEKQNWRSNLKWEGLKAIEVHDYFGFDHLHRLAAPYTHVYNEASSNDGKWIVKSEFSREGVRDKEITTIKTPEKTLKQVKKYDQTSKYTYVEALTEYYIKDKSDFEQFVKYQPSYLEGTYNSIKDQFENFNEVKKALGDKGIVAGFAGGAFNMLNNYRNLELMMMDPYTDPGFYREMMDYFTDRVFQLIERLAHHNVDVIETGGNLAAGSVGERFFSKYVFEYEKKIADKIHSYGIFDIYHNCGDADKIMHLYNDMGINAWGYLTPAPFGDVDIDKALKIMKKDRVLMGNIDQVEFLKKASISEVKLKIKELLEKVKKRGNFILSTSDWWMDDMPYENLKMFAEAGLEYGNY